MPDSSEHALNTIEFAGITFGKLTVTDRAKLLRDYKAAAKSDLDAALSGMPPEQKYIELRTFNANVWGTNKWVAFINDFDCQNAILRTALLKHNPPDRIDSLLNSLVLAEDDTLKLIGDLAGCPYTPVPVVPNMKHVGSVNGLPVYTPTGDVPVTSEGGDEPDPIHPGTPKVGPPGPTGNPSSYGS